MNWTRDMTMIGRGESLCSYGMQGARLGNAPRFTQVVWVPMPLGNWRCRSGPTNVLEGFTVSGAHSSENLSEPFDSGVLPATFQSSGKRAALWSSGDGMLVQRACGG